MDQEERKRRPGRKFSDELKRDAVEIVRDSGKLIAQVAGKFGIYNSTLGNWVKQNRIDRGEREGWRVADAASCQSCVAITPGCRWSVNSQSELWPSG